LAGLDTLTNIELNWSIDDVFDAHEALDIKNEQEMHHYETRGK
jgi:hypothetical protein